MDGVWIQRSTENVCCWCVQRKSCVSWLDGFWKLCKDCLPSREPFPHGPTSTNHVLCEKCAVELGVIW